MKKKVGIFIVALTICIGITYKYNTSNKKEIGVTQKTVTVSKQEKEELNNHFTIFSKYKLEEFSENSLSVENAIDFAVQYNFDNNFEKFSIYKERCCAYIDKEYIEKTVNHYFGINIDTYSSTEKHEFIEDKYIAPLASGGSYNFSKIINLYEIEKDKLLAELEIYHAEGNFMGDINEDKEAWEKGEGEVPELIGKKKAVLKRINEGGKGRYILLSYENF